MANIMDYLDWRGDIPLSVSPFNEVDNLILAELSFLDMTGIVKAPGQRHRGVGLPEAAQRYLDGRSPDTMDMGVLVPGQIPKLLEKAAASRRFGSMKFNYYTNIIDYSKQEQFAAVTIEVGDGSVYISFRGTDDTLVGWKEDFNLSFLQTIPSQQDALIYLKQVAMHYPVEHLRVGGHSKGGNLSVYSAVHCPEWLQRRILQVYNNDGPGFSQEILSTKEHQRISDRILTIVPQSSVVGMLLEHEEKYQVVQSSETGLYQHDGFSWQVLGTQFVHLEEISREGRFNDKALRAWVKGMDLPQREAFAEALYEVLTTNDAKTLKDLQEDGLKAMLSMLKTIKNLDKGTRDLLIETLKQLFFHGARIFGEDLREDLREGERRKRLSGKTEQEK